MQKLDEAIGKNKDRIANALRLMLDGDLSAQGYKKIKNQFEQANSDLLREKAKLMAVEEDYSQQIDYTFTLLKDLALYYQTADLETKQRIVGSIFPGKLIYDGKKYRTKRMNEAAALIYQNINELALNKIGLESSIAFQPNRVGPAGIEPATL